MADPKVLDAAVRRYWADNPLLRGCACIGCQIGIGLNYRAMRRLWPTRPPVGIEIQGANALVPGAVGAHDA